MKVWWVWQVGLTGEGKEQRRGDATTSLRRCDTANARNPYSERSLPGFVFCWKASGRQPDWGSYFRTITPEIGWVVEGLERQLVYLERMSERIRDYLADD